MRNRYGKSGALKPPPSNPTDVEIMLEGVSKGNALIELARILGVERENVMALGDNYNDVPMLRWAGIGVAVSNAVDAAKEAATGSPATAGKTVGRRCSALPWEGEPLVQYAS